MPKEILLIKRIFKKSAKTKYTWNTKCSRTVKVPMNRSSCCTYADTLVIEAPTFSPFTKTSPFTTSLRRFRLVRTLSSVVFPAPLAPMMAKSWPG